MANHPSALKRHRQSIKRRQRNQAVKTRVRHLVRAVRSAVGLADVETARSRLAEAVRALDKATTKGVYHRNSTSRRIGRLSRAVARLSVPADG